MKQKNKLKLRDHRALAYLLAAVAAGGRAFLGVPAEVTAADVSLTGLWLAALLLLGWAARRIWYVLPPLGMAAMELYLCSAGGGAVLLWAALRAADLLLLSLCTLLVMRSARTALPGERFARQARWMLAIQGLLWAALAVLLPACALRPALASLATARSTVFLAYSMVQLWFVVLAVRAYQVARAAQ